MIIWRRRAGVAARGVAAGAGAARGVALVLRGGFIVALVARSARSVARRRHGARFHREINK